MKRNQLDLIPLLGACALLLGGTAHAQQLECESDADCGHGYVCETGSIQGCPDIACAEGEECDLPACEPEEYAQCVLAPCEQDGDCPDGLLCASSTYEQCDWDEVPCEEGGECKPAEPTNCREMTDRYCAPPWQLPCTQDSDCGEGFTCEEQISMWCSGSAGSAGDGEPAPEPTEPECGSEPTGEYHCVQQEILCQADGDCPELWSCIDNPQRAVCARPAGGDGGDSEEVPCGNDDQAQRVCWPPEYNRGGFGIAEASGAPVAGGEAGGVTQDSAANTRSTAGGDDGNAIEDDAESMAPMGGSDSTCSAGGPATGGDFAWLALGLALLLRRCQVSRRPRTSHYSV